MEIGKVIGVYRYERKFTAPDTTTKTFKGRKAPRNCIVIITSGYVVDYTTANKKLIVGREDQSGDQNYIVVEKASGVFTAHLTGEMILQEGDLPIAIVESPTANDVLYCAFYGLIREVL